MQIILKPDDVHAYLYLWLKQQARGEMDVGLDNKALTKAVTETTFPALTYFHILRRVLTECSFLLDPMEGGLGPVPIEPKYWSQDQSGRLYRSEAGVDNGDETDVTKGKDDSATKSKEGEKKKIMIERLLLLWNINEEQ